MMISAAGTEIKKNTNTTGLLDMVIKMAVLRLKVMEMVLTLYIQ